MIGDCRKSLKDGSNYSAALRIRPRDGVGSFDRDDDDDDDGESRAVDDKARPT